MLTEDELETLIKDVDVSLHALGEDAEVSDVEALATLSEDEEEEEALDVDALIVLANDVNEALEQLGADGSVVQDVDQLEMLIKSVDEALEHLDVVISAVPGADAGISSEESDVLVEDADAEQVTLVGKTQPPCVDQPSSAWPAVIREAAASVGATTCAQAQPK